MKKWVYLITTSFILSANIAYAEKLATELIGEIVTKNPAELQIFITESDGSILDIATTSASGEYKLDLTVMDTPSLSEVEKLILEIKNKSGTKKKFKIKKYLNSFNDVVELKPILFNAN